VNASFSFGSATEFGFKVRSTKRLPSEKLDDEQYTLVGFSKSGNQPGLTAFVDRTRSGNVSFHHDFPGIHSVKLLPSNEVQVQIFVDLCSVEVFLQNGVATISDLIFPSPNIDNQHLYFYVMGGDVTVLSLEIFNLF